MSRGDAISDGKIFQISYQVYLKFLCLIHMVATVHWLPQADLLEILHLLLSNYIVESFG